MQLDEAAIFEEFRRRRSRQLALGFIVLPIALVGVWVRHNAHLDCSALALFLALGAPAAMMALAFSVKNWRCPACDAYLGKRANPSACPKCGALLRSDSPR
jgi:hypothetical protein